MNSQDLFFFFFFFNDTATTEIYTLSLHDALPILVDDRLAARLSRRTRTDCQGHRRHSKSQHEQPDLVRAERRGRRSEEHTSELQSPCNLVCRLLLEKKKKNKSKH